MHRSTRDEILNGKSGITWTGIEKKKPKTVYPTPADSVSFHLMQKEPQGETKTSPGLMYNHEPNSAGPVIDCVATVDC